MVRVAQDFSLRYPLVDGQGSFGSRRRRRGGDALHRMPPHPRSPSCCSSPRSTKARSISIPNYDGAFEEPQPAASAPALRAAQRRLGHRRQAWPPDTAVPQPARSGPPRHHCHREPHRRRGRAAAATSRAGLPGGGRLISPAAEDIRAGLRTGRRFHAAGPLGHRRPRPRPVAAGGQRAAAGRSTAQVLFGSDPVTNPQPKTGKESIDADQAQLKA